MKTSTFALLAGIALPPLAVPAQEVTVISFSCQEMDVL